MLFSTIQKYLNKTFNKLKLMTNFSDMNSIVPLIKENEETKNKPTMEKLSQETTNNTENNSKNFNDSSNIVQDLENQDISSNINTPKQEFSVFFVEKPMEVIPKTPKKVSVEKLISDLVNNSPELIILLIKNKSKTFSVKVKDPVTKKHYRIHLSTYKY